MTPPLLAQAVAVFGVTLRCNRDDLDRPSAELGNLPFDFVDDRLLEVETRYQTPMEMGPLRNRLHVTNTCPSGRSRRDDIFRDTGTLRAEIMDRIGHIHRHPLLVFVQQIVQK